MTSTNPNPEFEVVFEPCFCEPLEMYKTQFESCTSMIFSNIPNKDRLAPYYKDRFDYASTHMIIQWLPPRLKKLCLPDTYCKSIILPDTLEHFETGINFNSPLVLPMSLTYLQTGGTFNQPLQIPIGMVYLEFGREFNQPLEIAQHLELDTLYFGDEFNIRICLPKNLKKIRLGHRFEQKIILPEKLEHIEIGCSRLNTYYLDQLPNSIKCVTIRNSFDVSMCVSLANLPNSVDSLTMNSLNSVKDLSTLQYIKHLTLASKFKRTMI